MVIFLRVNRNFPSPDLLMSKILCAITSFFMPHFRSLDHSSDHAIPPQLLPFFSLPFFSSFQAFLVSFLLLLSYNSLKTQRQFKIILKKPSGTEGGGDKSQGPCSPNTWSPELLGPGKGTKFRPNRVCVSEEYLRT